MIETKGLIFVALIVIVLMGAVIVVQQEQIKEQNPANLPFCEYSTVINVQGLTHEGYYIGVDENQKMVCQQSLIEEGAVIDLGL